MDDDEGISRFEYFVVPFSIKLSANFAELRIGEIKEEDISWKLFVDPFEKQRPKFGKWNLKQMTNSDTNEKTMKTIIVLKTAFEFTFSIAS